MRPAALSQSANPTLLCCCATCAAPQDTIVAIRRGGDKLVVANLETDKYPTMEFSTDPSQVRSSAAQNSSSTAARMHACVLGSSTEHAPWAQRARQQGRQPCIGVACNLARVLVCTAGGGCEQAHLGQLLPVSVQGGATRAPACPAGLHPHTADRLHHAAAPACRACLTTSAARACSRPCPWGCRSWCTAPCR